MARVGGVPDTLTARRFRLTVVMMTVGALLVHLVASARVGHPSVVFDEAGYLGNARWLARSGAGWDMPTAPRYALGYPLVIAPVTRVFTSAGPQWRAILGVNAVLLASMVPLVAAVARRVLGAARGPALLAAGIGALAPAVVAAGVSAIAENLALPLVPASVLALHATRSRGPKAYLFGPVVALLYATHARFTVAIVLGLVVLAVGSRRRLMASAVAMGNAALLVAGTLVAWIATRAVEAARWDNVERLEGGPEEIRNLITSFDGLQELTSTAVGQAWYLTVGSLGLSVIGVAGLVSALRARQAQAGDETRSAPGIPVTAGGRGSRVIVDRLAVGYLLTLAAAVFAVSVAFFAQNRFRADHLVYGRHNDSFTPLWLAAGVLTLLAADRRRLLRLGALAGGAIVVLFAWLAIDRDADTYDGRYSAFAVPAIIRYVAGNPSGTFWRASLAGLVGLLAVLLVLLGTRRPRLLGPLLVVWFVWAGFGTTGATAAFQRVIYRDWEVPTEVRALGVDAVSIDIRSAGAGFTDLSYPFHLPDVRFTTFDPALGEGPDQPFVLARTEDRARRDAGDRIALIDQSGFYAFWGAEQGVAFWVRPGPEQDRLAEAGLLLPDGFPTGLPDSARRAEVEITDGRAGTEVEVAPGGSVDVAVRGRHTGTGSPWPGEGNFNGPARVRLIATIEALYPGGPAGARSGGEIPGWTTPGEEFSATASVFALTQTLGPLPPGRYRVGLGVTQDMPPWAPTSDPRASFIMVVTEA